MKINQEGLGCMTRKHINLWRAHPNQPARATAPASKNRFLRRSRTKQTAMQQERVCERGEGNKDPCAGGLGVGSRFTVNLDLCDCRPNHNHRTWTNTKIRKDDKKKRERREKKQRTPHTKMHKTSASAILPKQREGQQKKESMGCPFGESCRAGSQ